VAVLTISTAFGMFRSVRELSQELLRLLTQRASSGPAGTVPFLHNQDDINKVRKLLELQADR